MMNENSKRRSLQCGIAVVALLLTSHVLVYQEFFVRMLLIFADLDFWVTYFDAIFYSFFAIVFIVIQRKALLQCLHDYRANYKKYLPHAAISVPITMVLVVIVAIILSSLGIGESSNEAAISEAVKANPVIEGVTALLIGPFVEEMVFRGFIYESVRRRIKNDRKLVIWLWVFIATAIFALSHCELEDFTSLKLMASYLIVFVEGLVMTGLYEKDRNIFSSLLLHCSINFIAFLN